MSGEIFGIPVQQNFGFVARAKQILALNENQKNSLVNFVRKFPEFIDALAENSGFIVKLHQNGGLSGDDKDYIDSLVKIKS